MPHPSRFATALPTIRAYDQFSRDQLLMRTEISNMKPNEPSRTALVVARQRAAHQALDHGSILYDPSAMKILREDEKDVLQFANGQTCHLHGWSTCPAGSGVHRPHG
jgi:hypothetical protein